uniref:Uncharacterized protein n=1 Tax=Oryzias latipes TaxID=8090 RepID=A0A3P9INP8_ORYLA
MPVLRRSSSMPIRWGSSEAEMTFPRVTRDLLMFPPSFSRTPVAPVASARSLPARSTRWILLIVSLERLLTSFMPVLAVVRLMFPASINKVTRTRTSFT